LRCSRSTMFSSRVVITSLSMGHRSSEFSKWYVVNRRGDNLDSIVDFVENCTNHLDYHADDMFLLVQKSVPGFSRYES
jgi:hypothetical protein